ncbi:MAG: energy transducer TonB [Pseudomonadota bacterium]
MSSATLPLTIPLPVGNRFHTRRHPASLVAIAAAHAALVWLFLQADVVSRAVHQVSPLMVALLSEPAAPRPPEPSLPRQPARPLPTPALLPPPEVRVAEAPAAPPPATVVVASVVTPQAPAAVTTPVQAEPVSVRAVVAAPPAPPVLSASAIRYRVPPAIEVPMASRRLGEAGTVLLRVWVDAQGLPRQVSLHRSSGFARLDEQALAAMRQARFQPVNDGGNAIEWVVIAPLQYEID